MGYEAHALSVHDAERFAQTGKAWRWMPTTELAERLRAAKDEGEVAAIRSAALLAGEALRQTFAQVSPGMTELAIAGVLEGRCAGWAARAIPSRPSWRPDRAARCPTRARVAVRWRPESGCC